MRLASLIASAAGILGLLSASGVSAQSAAEEPRSGWYVGGGIGATWPSNLAQSGSNRDPICYPTDACFDQDPRLDISGYRWHYDIAAATGPVFELSTGLFVDRARVELSFRQRWNDLDQMFLSVTNYEGVAMEDRVNSTVTSDTRSSIDHLAVRMLTVNAYYDFAAESVVSPYLGDGVGPAFVTVAGVRFSDEYRDTAVNSDVYDPPLSFYNTSLDDDLSDTVLAGHLHGGRRRPYCRQDLAGAEDDLLDAGRYRDPRRIRPARRSRAGPGLRVPQHVRRRALLDADVHGQVRLRQLSRRGTPLAW